MAWLTQRGNNARTGRVFEKGVDRDFIAVFAGNYFHKLDLEGRLISQPEENELGLITKVAASSNRIVAVAEKKGNHVFDFQGKYLWHAEAPEDVTEHFQPLMTDDRIIFSYLYEDEDEPSAYVHDSCGEELPTGKILVECYDHDGNLQWGFGCNAYRAKQATIKDNGFFMPIESGLLILNLKGDRRVRSLITDYNGGAISNSVLADSNGIYFVAGLSDGPYTIKADFDGTETATTRKSHFAIESCSDDRNIIFKEWREGGGLCAFDKQESRILWENELHSHQMPVIFGNNIFLYKREGDDWDTDLYCLSTQGTVRWKRREKSAIWGNITVDDDLLVYNTMDGMVRAFDFDNEMKWKYPTGHNSMVSDGVVVRYKTSQEAMEY